jgi:hypothetical protein
MKLSHLIFAITVILLLTAALFSHFNFEGDFDGIYLLKGPPGKLFELKDDILLGEYERLIAKIEFQAFHERWRSKDKTGDGHPYLKYQWSRKTGKGYFISFFPDGTKFLACFGRYLDDFKNPVKGLFVGGGLPKSHYETAEVKMNQTGVAFFSGKEWHHLWCNANEAIFSSADATKQITPGQWEFLGSKVLFASQFRLALKSSHLAKVGQIPVKIDRYLIYHAGDRFFTLINRLTNTGDSPLCYHYTYGDEPWVGDYGSSEGNVGWTRERLYNYEDMIDTRKNSYAGMFDYGNPVIGEKPVNFTGLANFLEWQGDNLPTTAYFSNRLGILPSETAKVPLSDKTNRVLMLQWDSRTLLPGQSGTMILTIGMAENDPKSGIPRKPAVTLDPEELRYILSR